MFIDGSALAALLPNLYAARNVDAFLETSLRLIEDVIPVDQSLWLGYSGTEPLRLTTCVGRTASLFRQVADRLVEGLPTHPFARHYARTQSRTALMSSDFTPEEWQPHRHAYDDVYQLVRLNHLLGVPVQDERGLLALNLIREHRPFEERDRACLNWLHPHLEQALRNATVWTLTTAHEADRVHALAEYLELTSREAEVAFWLSLAKTNQEIAFILNVAPRTVEKHVERVLKALRVENRTAAALAISAALREIACRPAAETPSRPDGWQVFARVGEHDT